jgi:hypothetical protein
LGIRLDRWIRIARIGELRLLRVVHHRCAFS